VVLLSVNSACASFLGRWTWFVHSGTMVVYTALATPFLVPFRDHIDVELMAVVDLDPGMMRGTTSQLGEDVESPGAALLSRTAKQIKNALLAVHMMRHEKKKVPFWAMYRKTIVTAFQDALNEGGPVMLAIAGYASIAKLMSGFGMTQTIANALVSVFGKTPALFGFASPLLGLLGAGLTGSTTTSNFLFGRLQVQTALNLGLVTPTTGSVWAVAGIQMLGSTAGELIAPQNAVFSVVLLKGVVPDSAIIRGLLPFTFLFWLAACMCTGIISIGSGIAY